MDEKCAANEILIQEYLSGCLSDGQKREMFSHIALCPRCREELAWQNGLKKAACAILIQPPEELGSMIMMEAAQQKYRENYIAGGIKDAFNVLRSSRNAVSKELAPVKSCLKLAYKCI